MDAYIRMDVCMSIDVWREWWMDGVMDGLKDNKKEKNLNGFFIAEKLKYIFLSSFLTFSENKIEYMIYWEILHLSLTLDKKAHTA